MKTYMRAQAAPWRRGVEFYIGTPEGKLRVKEIVMEKIEDIDLCQQPSFSMETEQAQALMDDLWNAGLRPTEGTGSAGALRATQQHLEDMRKIAFNGLKMEGAA